MENSKRDMYQKAMAELLRQGTPIRIPVFGYSMVPILFPGCVVDIRPCKFDEVFVGDIVFFDDNNLLVLHRVIKKDQEGVICKGDARLKRDAWVNGQAILGKLSAWRKGGPNGRWVGVGTQRDRFFAFISVNFPLVAGCFFRFYAVACMRGNALFKKLRAGDL